MRLRTQMLGLASIFVLAACAQPPAQEATDTAVTPADAEAVGEAIRAHVDQFVSAWNTADFATIGPTIAEDAVLMAPDGPVVQGRDAILAVMGEGYDPALAQQSATVDEVVMIGDYAYGRGTWNVDPTPEAGAEAPSANGKWSLIYERGADGGWQIWRWMWNQPSAEAPADE